MRRVAKTAIVIVLFALSGCDPAAIARLDVTKTPAATGIVPKIVADAAARHELTPVPGNIPAELRFSRFWGTVEDGHPNEIQMSVRLGTAPSDWQIEIFEWLVFSQSAFGDQLQADIVRTLESRGYRVSTKK